MQSRYEGPVDLCCDVAVLGGVSLNVGCIPSKALLHVASIMGEVKHLARAGIAYGAPTIDLDTLRQHKTQVVGKLTGGLSKMAQARKVRSLRGVGEFLDPFHLRINGTTGDGQAQTGRSQVLRFKYANVAAGSKPVRLPFLPADERIVDSTGALSLPFVPQRMVVIGGGIIGLEKATVYASLGARIDVVEASDGSCPAPIGIWRGLFPWAASWAVASWASTLATSSAKWPWPSR
jgi:dihydrolipoamide dehydrogenase